MRRSVFFFFKQLIVLKIKKKFMALVGFGIPRGIRHRTFLQINIVTVLGTIRLAFHWPREKNKTYFQTDCFGSCDNGRARVAHVELDVFLGRAKITRTAPPTSARSKRSGKQNAAGTRNKSSVSDGIHKMVSYATRL